MPSGDADVDLVGIELLRAAGEDRAADRAMSTLAQAYPGDPLVGVRMAFVEFDAGQVARSLELLESIEEDLQRLPGARTLRAKLWIRSGRADLGERALRGLLQDPVEGPGAGFALVDLLTLDERFGDALAVLAAVRARDPDRADLVLVHARLLHDVWALDEAAELLDACRARHPGLALVALQRAELAVARGDRDLAVAELAVVTRDDAFTRAHRDRVLGVQEAVASERPSFTARDLLAVVRGASEPAARRQAFEALQGEDLLRRAAVAAALGQSDPILRAVAVRRMEPRDPGFSGTLQRALGDPDPRVRGASARRLPEVGDPEVGLGLAHEALAAEENPYAFRAIHEALSALRGADVALPPGGESDPLVRSKTREAWSRECPE
jgi:tetratricopeptide (TPR) repeat protein